MMDSLLKDPTAHRPGPPEDHDAPTRIMTSEPESSGRASEGWSRLLKRTATGWYLSLAFHLIAYAIAVLVFGWLGLNVVKERPEFKPHELKASLDDESRVDELPALQIVSAPGTDAADAPQSLQQLASQLAMAERGQMETLVTDARIAAVGSDAAEFGDEEKSPFFRVPESGFAVTKGSFTAWTDPERPAPGEFYQIIIEIRLPDDVERYRITDDLSGFVTGTDRYRQRLPYDSRSPLAARVTGGAAYQPVTRNMTLKITGKKLQLAVRVPGARRLVKDRIRIKSRKLNEEQELVLVFGGAEKLPGLKLDEK